MGSAEIVTGSIESVYFGETDITNPIMFLEVNGVPQAAGNVLQSIGSSIQYIYPRLVGTSIYVTSISQVYGSDIPAITISVRIQAAS